MRSIGWNSVLTLALMLAVALACKFSASTANISSLKIGKDKNVSTETNKFGPRDTVYGVAEISNAPGKIKVKGRLLADDIEGVQKGPLPGLEDTVELGGSGTAIFTFSPASSGWPKGKYKLEVIMLNEQGEQKDQKDSTFTIS